MKKIFTKKIPLNIFLAFLMLFSFLFANYAYAAAKITYTNLQPTSVTLKVTGLDPNETYELRVYIPPSSTSPYYQSPIVKPNSDGMAEASFSNLSPGGKYEAAIVILGFNRAKAKLSFTTPTVTTSIPLTCTLPQVLDPATDTCTCPSGQTWDSAVNLCVLPTVTIDSGEGLVPCTEECGWDELMKLISNVIDFLIFKLALPLAAIAFAWAGVLFMTSGDDPSKRTKGKKIFWNVFIGLVIAMAAWLIVNTILTSLINTEEKRKEFILLEKNP